MARAREIIASLIEDGEVGGRLTWGLEIIYPVRFNEEAVNNTQQTIANFVREGVMEGVSPAWKVWVDPVVTLD